MPTGRARYELCNVQGAAAVCTFVSCCQHSLLVLVKRHMQARMAVNPLHSLERYNSITICWWRKAHRKRDAHMIAVFVALQSKLDNDFSEIFFGKQGACCSQRGYTYHKPILSYY